MIRDVNIQHDDDAVRVTIASTYRGGCELVRITQWVERVDTGELRQLSDYVGPPRRDAGDDTPHTYITSLGRALEPGYWVWHAESICTHATGRQEQFRAPATRFFVEGPT